MEKLVKKFFGVFCALLMVITVSACSSKTQPTIKTEVPTQTPTKPQEPNTSIPGDDGSIRSELTAIEVARLMGNGINLGNTMEAYGHISLGTNAAVSSYETLWGQPITTQEMISAMREAGFDTIRIPVAWTNMMDYESGNYTINEAYLDRVEELINYARNEGMYVIINDHWDGSWWGMFGSGAEETRTKAMEIYVAMWTQIATRYEKYSDHLIFESANEELGNRLNDTNVAKDSGTLSYEECYQVTNEINQKFVDVIRGTGGNNESRFLLIAGFNTDIDTTCDSRFVMPTDTIQNKLLISVHYYTPSIYCINEGGSTWGNQKEFEEQNAFLEKMTQFTEKGYGVVIGEYGVFIREDDSLKEGTIEYYTNFLANCDLYGYAPMLWDCNRLFSKSELKIINDQVAKMYKEGSFTAQSSKTEEEVKKEAKAVLATMLANSKEADVVPEDVAMAWIMYNSSDWSTAYRVGDEYPAQMTEGIIATDVEITGEGTYTVSLDFSKTGSGSANSMVFSAVGILHGETLFPGYVIDIKEVLINGKPYELLGKPYTTSDNAICTRVNLYNDWISKLPDHVRTIHGSAEGCSAKLMDAETLGQVTTISVTFDFVAGN